MRLLFLTETYPPDRGGMSESCDRIVRGLRAAGTTVDLVHFDRRGIRESFHPTIAGTRLRWPLQPDAAHTINCLWNALQRQLDLRATTHVVAFGGTLPLLAAPSFAAWIDRPLVTMLRGNELDAGLFDPRRRPILDDAIQRSSAVCTLTTTHAAKVAALYRTTKPCVVPNGLDFDLWSATDADRERAARWRRDNVDSSRRVIGLFGDLKAKKGVPLFLQALLRSGMSERFHLLIIGEVDDATRDRLQVEERLTFSQHGAMDRLDLLPHDLACDLIALPSHYDGFPNVLIEAMALAKPLLASRTGGMADVLKDDESAFLFEPGDEEECAGAIRRAAAADDASLHRMSERALTDARTACDAGLETKRYLDVLAAVAPSELSAVEES